MLVFKNFMTLEWEEYLPKIKIINIKQFVVSYFLITHSSNV